ncbi:HD domain-containing phosphohydrolase [Rhizobium sp. L1K21]|uniref:HD domain-containing phosphohydrolase n=1 Tax=Rhizobium sp. L1K21 TaxID=2954933 RepID=UPI002092480A|nr:HD domain-containing phosphohydrolase [Rhizobium sp. L1K21]MCO6188612.1 response regulator [Rhizobium sp. L1K21]
MIVFSVDDSSSVLSFLKLALSEIKDASVRTFLKPCEALECLRKEPADLLIVDYAMPDMNGIELIKAVRANANVASIPIIMLTSETDSAVKMAAMEAGATEFLQKPIDKLELIIRVRNFMGLWRAERKLAKRAMRLERDMEAASNRIAKQEEEIIWRLSRAMACRDGETAEHVSRVALVSKLIAEELGLDDEAVRTIYMASPLHDVGKIGIPDAILLKPGRLTEEEFASMRQHSAFGAEVLEGSSSEVIQTAAIIAESHHEKWDGSGYPKGLSKDEIPIEGRIVAVADVFDALCSERPYKPAWKIEKAFQEIMRCSGTHFDPACVAAFCRGWQQVAEIYSAESGELQSVLHPSFSAQFSSRNEDVA